MSGRLRKQQSVDAEPDRPLLAVVRALTESDSGADLRDARLRAHSGAAGSVTEAGASGPTAGQLLAGELADAIVRRSFGANAPRLQQKVEDRAGATSFAGGAGPGRRGFIDNSQGSNLRTGPTQLGGRPVLSQPLPPAQEVMVHGVHPDAVQWKAITTVVDGRPVSGFVDGARVNDRLPEPGARLYSIALGDTAEGLARLMFRAAAEDGWDYRFYENVLLNVNRDEGRDGIAGSYQDPTILGTGSDNIRLIAGKRIWLVIPTYAISRRGLVPSGSFSGGMVAKARRVAERLADIALSVEFAPDHVGEVAGEIVQAMLEHLPEMAAVTAIFVAGELASAALAGTVAGAPIAALIQLLLAIWGAKLAVDVLAAAARHGERWLSLAWDAHGDQKVIHDGSRELVRTFAAIVGGVLALAGVRANLGRAITIGTRSAEAAAVRAAVRSTEVGTHGPIPGAHQIKVSPTEYLQILESGLGSHALDPLLSVIEGVGQRAGRASVANLAPEGSTGQVCSL